MSSSTAAVRYIPTQHALKLSPADLIRDLSFQFVRMTRQSTVNQWFRRHQHQEFL